LKTKLADGNTLIWTFRRLKSHSEICQQRKDKAILMFGCKETEFM